MSCEKHLEVSRFLDRIQEELTALRYAHFLRDHEVIVRKAQIVADFCCQIQSVIRDIEGKDGVA